jgi:SEFIR domain
MPAPPTAFISWAHSSSSWAPARTRRWRQTVVDFATSLRVIGGIDADLDLWHLATHEDWSTFGVSGIRDSDFVLIAVSDAYRQRWEDTEDPSVGAGAAREANAIKSIFDLDRHDFRRRVKVVLLPGAEVDDIPLELLSSTERIRIEKFDLHGLAPLWRSLHGLPDLTKPPVGPVPSLPPSYEAQVRAAAELDDDDPLTLDAALQRRVVMLDAQLAADLPVYERTPIENERVVLRATLAALSSSEAAEIQPPLSPNDNDVRPDEVLEAAERGQAVIASACSAVQPLPPIAREALFQYFRSKAPLTVGGDGDDFGIREAIRAEEQGFVSWVEDEDQKITPRTASPAVEAAILALRDVRAVVFGGDSLSSRARAAPWARLLVRDEYGVEDAEFELRPTWEALGFLPERRP